MSRARVIACLIALVSALVVAPAPVRATPSLEALIASVTGISRVVDGGLQARATVRVDEIQIVWEHGSLEPGEAEVIGTNFLVADPFASIVAGWLASGEHAVVLTDQDYARVGCASEQDATARHWFVCLFKTTAPASAPDAPPPAITLPNTAMEAS